MKAQPNPVSPATYDLLIIGAGAAGLCDLKAAQQSTADPPEEPFVYRIIELDD